MKNEEKMRKIIISRLEDALTQHRIHCEGQYEHYLELALEDAFMYAYVTDNITFFYEVADAFLSVEGIEELLNKIKKGELK